MIRQGLLWAILMGLCAWVYAQTTVNLDYGAYLNDFDWGSPDTGIARGAIVFGTWGDLEQSLQAAGASLALDAEIKFSGLRSQRISFSRTSGASGTLTFRFDPIHERHYIRPPEGYPVLVRIAYRAEEFRNATYRFRFRTGERWGTLLNDTNTSTVGWQVISQVIPVERSSDGNLYLRLYLEITLGNGAASGRIWIDGVRAIAQPLTIPARTRPNIIKVAHYLVLPSDLIEFHEVPIDLVVGGRDVSIARRLIPQIEEGVYFAPFTSFDVPALREADLYDYADCSLNHPDWFLLDANGNRIMDPAYAHNRPFYMDIGHPQAQNRVVERLRLLTRDRYFVPRWIFFDNWSDWPRGVQTTRQYRDWPSLMPAWTSLLNRVAPVIRQELGAKLMVNIGSRIAIFLDGNVGEQWLPNVDGVMQEGAWIIYNTREQRYMYRNYNATRFPVHFTDASWISTLRAVNTYPNKTW
ncbi:MAG: hypothetical protein RMK45_02810, partial [Armatimonadota bacterium]|nr:hypothetical protein [Armatimonadota bacterium]